MTMEKLEINKEDAIKAYNNSTKKEQRLLEDLFGKKTFQLKVTERIKSIEDLLEENGSTKEDFYDTYEGLEPDEISYILIKMLVNTLNEGWTPNWNDLNEPKYIPYFRSTSSGFSCGGCAYWASSSNVSSRLCYKSSELAKYAGTQFEELYRDFMIIK